MKYPVYHVHQEIYQNLTAFHPLFINSKVESRFHFQNFPYLSHFSLHYNQMTLCVGSIHMKHLHIGDNNNDDDGARVEGTLRASEAKKQLPMTGPQTAVLHLAALFGP